MKFVTGVAITLAIGAAFYLGIGLNGHAHAQGCNQTGYTYNSACTGNNDSAGTTVVAAPTILSSANATAGLVLNRVSAFRASGSAPGQTASGGGTINLLGFGTGAAAGEHSDRRWGLWVNGSFNRTVGSRTSVGFDSNNLSTMIGADFRPNRKVLLGVGFGYEMSDTDTEHNRGTIDGKGYTVAPYISLSLNDNFSIDAVGGLSRLSYDQDRLDPISNAKVTGSTDANRHFGSVNLVSDFEFEKLLLGARVGTFFLSEKQDAFTESDGVANPENTVSIANANAGVRLGLNAEIVRPYISGTYSFDYDDAGGNYDARNTYGGALGIDFHFTDNFFANVEGRGSKKSNLVSGGGSATLRYQRNF